MACVSVLALVDCAAVMLAGSAPAFPAVLVPVVAVGAVVAVVIRRERCAAATVALAGSSITLAVTAAVVGTSVMPSLAALFAFAVLTVGALQDEDAVTALVVTIAAGVGVLAEPARLISTDAFLAQALCIVCFGAAVVLGLYLRWVRWRRETIEAAARTDERLEIARELHDLVGHYLTGMVVQAQAAQFVAATNPGAAVEALARIESAGADAMVAMRRMVKGLRDDAARTPGVGWDEVESLAEDARRSGVPLRLEIDESARVLPLELTASVHRILAESLTNVRRHGRDVTLVDAEVKVEQGAPAETPRLVVRVHDDGVAPGPIVAGTYGLTGMHERAEALGGSLYAGPAPHGGWLVRAVFPVAPRDLRTPATEVVS